MNYGSGLLNMGLDVMNIQTGKVIRHYSKGSDSNLLKSNFIYCIYQSKDNEIMLGTTIGAYLYNRKTNDFSLLAGHAFTYLVFVHCKG